MFHMFFPGFHTELLLSEWMERKKTPPEWFLVELKEFKEPQTRSSALLNGSCSKGLVLPLPPFLQITSENPGCSQGDPTCTYTLGPPAET